MATNASVVFPAGAKEISLSMSKDELIKNLKILSEVMQELDGDAVNIQRFEPLAQFLIGQFFTKHSSKDVKLLVGCCVADILRIFAPEQPYKQESQLRELFMFLIKTLKGVEETSSANYRRYFYLLECLANSKSFLILSDLDPTYAVSLTGKLFNVLFQSIREDHTNKVRSNMLEIMCPLLSHTECVSPEILDLICQQILEPTKSQNPARYQLACDLLHLAANNVEPLVLSFFNDVLLTSKDSDDKEGKSPLISRIYELMYELYKTAPSTVLSVLPQLEIKLKGTEDDRFSAVSLLGKMFSDESSQLFLENNNLWKCYQSRSRDLSVRVREEYLRHAANIIVNHQYEVGADTISSILSLAHDLDEHVRQEVIIAIGEIGRLNFALLNDDLMGILKQRLRDTKWPVRQEAATCVANLYRRIANNSRQHRDGLNDSDFARIAWARDKILSMYYNKQRTDKLLAEKLLWTCLVDITASSEDRMKELLRLYCGIDAQSVKVIDEIFKAHAFLRQDVISLLEIINLDDVKKSEKTAVIVQKCTLHFLDQAKARDCLKRFVELLNEDVSVRNSLCKLVNSKTTCKEAVESVKLILSKMGTSRSQQSVVDCIRSLLERIASFLLDANSVRDLLGIIVNLAVKKDRRTLDIDEDYLEESIAIRAAKLVHVVASNYSYFFVTTDHLISIKQLFKTSDGSVILSALKSCISLATVKSNFSNESLEELSEIAHKIAVTADDASLTKYAILLINTLHTEKEAVIIFTDIFDELRKEIKLDMKNLIGALSAMTQIAFMYAHELHQNFKTLISSFIVKHLLMDTSASHSYDSEGTWCAKADLQKGVKAKIRGMKLITMWLRGLRDPSNNLVGSTLRLLYTMIANDGDLMESGSFSLCEKSHMRLTAAKMVLQIALVDVYRDSITNEQFQIVAALMMDACKEVRSEFASKLYKYLIQLKLPLQYLAILSLAAKDPNQEQRERHKQLFIRNVEIRRQALKKYSTSSREIVATLTPDYVMVFAVHLLAHHHEFDTLQNTAILKAIKDCLWFVMEPLMNNHDSFSYSFFKILLETIKMVKDAQCTDDDSANEKLYAVADLALTLLNSRSPKFESCPITSAGANMMIPAKLYTAPEPGCAVNTRIYIPKSLMEPSKVLPESNVKNKLKKATAKAPMASVKIKTAKVPIVEKQVQKTGKGKVTTPIRSTRNTPLSSPAVSNGSDVKSYPIRARSSRVAAESTRILDSSADDEEVTTPVSKRRTKLRETISLTESPILNEVDSPLQNDLNNSPTICFKKRPQCASPVKSASSNASSSKENVNSNTPPARRRQQPTQNHVSPRSTTKLLRQSTGLNGAIEADNSSEPAYVNESTRSSGKKRSSSALDNGNASTYPSKKLKAPVVGRDQPKISNVFSRILPTGEIEKFVKSPTKSERHIPSSKSPLIPKTGKSLALFVPATKDINIAKPRTAGAKTKPISKKLPMNSQSDSQSSDELNSDRSKQENEVSQRKVNSGSRSKSSNDSTQRKVPASPVTPTRRATRAGGVKNVIYLPGSVASSTNPSPASSTSSRLVRSGGISPATKTKVPRTPTNFNGNNVENKSPATQSIAGSSRTPKAKLSSKTQQGLQPRVSGLRAVAARKARQPVSR